MPGKTLLVAALSVLFFTVPALTQRRDIGRITTHDGTPIEGVIVITSGMGFEGSVSEKDGSFRLPSTGVFVVFRHPGYKPLLIRSSELIEPVHIRMDPVDETVWKMQSCRSLPGVGSAWKGGRLRVNPGDGYYEGPILGDHDSHWHIRHGKDWLHVGDGYALHTGLPPEERLAASDSISTRGWMFEKVVGLDLSGRREGKYWRWVGAPMAAVVEYRTSSRETADYFDKLIADMCYHSPGQTRH